MMNQQPEHSPSPGTDDAPPTSAAQLLALLERLGITYRHYRHPPLFTVEDSKQLRGRIDGAHVKNLFVANKGGDLWMMTVLEHRRVDLNRFTKALGAGRVSFAKPELLWRHWGVRPGAVTPFGALNDHARAVRVVLDRAIMDHALVNCHPLVNDQTIGISPDDLLRFLDHTGHEPLIAEIPERETAPDGK